MENACEILHIVNIKAVDAQAACVAQHPAEHM